MLALALVLLPGCTAIKLVYNAAPSAGYWWLDGYLDFDSAQAAQLREDLDDLQRWHRSTQLPQYALLLQRAQVLVGSERVTPEQACALLEDAKREIGNITAHAETGAATLVRSLTPEQLQHLQAKYTKSNNEFRKEWLNASAQEVRDKRFDKTLERAERVYGALDAPQRAVIRQLVDASSFDPKMQQAERLRRQQDTMQVLQGLAAGKATPEQITQALRGLFDRYRESPDPVLRAYGQRQTEEGCQGFALAHNTATPAQRQKAVQRLKAYEKDVRDLAAQQR